MLRKIWLLKIGILKYVVSAQDFKNSTAGAY